MDKLVFRKKRVSFQDFFAKPTAFFSDKAMEPNESFSSFHLPYILTSPKESGIIASIRVRLTCLILQKLPGICNRLSWFPMLHCLLNFQTREAQVEIIHNTFRLLFGVYSPNGEDAIVCCRLINQDKSLLPADLRMGCREIMSSYILLCFEHLGADQMLLQFEISLQTQAFRMFSETQIKVQTTF